MDNRENEVLKLLNSGTTLSTIADKLGMSVHTAKAYAHLLKKRGFFKPAK